MTTLTERYLKTGGDPRMLADYAALREEMNKLTHPARPDINWPYVEKRCLSLFEQNGVELQTAAWYTLARMHLAGLYGLNEGLAILEALVSRQWGNLWPQPVHARIEILSMLSKRLQQTMRTLMLTYTDLSQLYQAETYLIDLEEGLQRLELKHASQLDPLLNQVHQAAVRLEDSNHAGVSQSGEKAIPARGILTEPTESSRWIYVAEPELQPIVQTKKAASSGNWKPFAAGMLTMLVVAGARGWGWTTFFRPDPAEARLAATLSPLPVALSTEQQTVLRQKSLPPEPGIKQTQQQLERLAQLKPDWAVSYGDNLVQQALTLWPEQAIPLESQWRRQLNTAAFPVDSLSGWYQGMEQLQQLANRLNSLDEQKGKYITVSELKSAVFTMMQSFNHTVPVEERLRQLSEQQKNITGSSAQRSQTEQHLQQLIVRFALLKQSNDDTPSTSTQHNVNTGN